MLPVTLAIRATAAWSVARAVLGVRLNWLLLPVEDVAAFYFWIAGFFGKKITWRGRSYRLEPDGRFELLTED